VAAMDTILFHAPYGVYNILVCMFCQ